MIVEVLLRVCGFDVDSGEEMTMFNTDTDVQKSDMGGEVFQVKWTGY